MKNGIKMIDIANRLGVSVVTISNALAVKVGYTNGAKEYDKLKK